MKRFLSVFCCVWYYISYLLNNFAIDLWLEEEMRSLLVILNVTVNLLVMSSTESFCFILLAFILNK